MIIACCIGDNSSISSISLEFIRKASRVFSRGGDSTEIEASQPPLLLGLHQRLERHIHLRQRRPSLPALSVSTAMSRHSSNSPHFHCNRSTPSCNLPLPRRNSLHFNWISRHYRAVSLRNQKFSRRIQGYSLHFFSSAWLNQRQMQRLVPLSLHSSPASPRNPRVSLRNPRNSLRSSRVC